MGETAPAILSVCTSSEARILTLVIVDGLRPAEAARVLKCSRANVSQTMTRAIRKIRQADHTPPHAPATTTPTAPPEPRQASPYPPELLARYIEIITVESLMCAAPDGIERYQSGSSSREVFRPGDPLGNRHGGPKRPRKVGHYDQFELDAIRVMHRTEPRLPESDYQPWNNYTPDGKRIVPKRAVSKSTVSERDTRQRKGRP